VYHHCEGSKEELVRDVSRFYSSSHDRFTYGSSFINFNLPQFYQIVQLDGRTQVIPFRSNALSHLHIADKETSSPAQQFQLH
ncbi:TPA: class I adenylate cyclase, partial [Yersinia enterocolitica]